MPNYGYRSLTKHILVLQVYHSNFFVIAPVAASYVYLIVFITNTNLSLGIFCLYYSFSIYGPFLPRNPYTVIEFVVQIT